MSGVGLYLIQRVQRTAGAQAGGPSSVAGVHVPLNGVVDGLVLPTAGFAETHAALASAPEVLSSHYLATLRVHKPLEAVLEPPATFFAVTPLVGEDGALADALRLHPSVQGLFGAAGLYTLWGFVDGAREVAEAALSPVLRGRTRHALLATTSTPIDAAFAPVAAPVAVEGQHYQRLSHKKERRLAAGGHEHFTPAMLADFGRGVAELARGWIAIEREHGPLELLFAPARGARPLVDGMLEHYRRQNPERPPWEPLVVYPPTSSFLTGVHGPGHNGIELELARLWERGVLPCRVGYVDEIISGGMFRRHVKAFTSLRQRHDVEDRMPVHGFALADRGGKRFRAASRFRDEALAAGRLATFDCVPVMELISEDRRQLLGIHYADYAQGLHAVPYVASDGADTPERVAMWRGILDAGG